MSFKKWIVGTPDKEFARLAENEFDIDPFTALLTCSRGISDITELEYFLSDEPILSDARELIDIEKAADCINEAIDSGLKIGVFGDYDCDGVMATAIMCKYLASRNANVIPYIPDRISEGYGMNTSAVDELKAQGVELIITVDNGIASEKEVAYASSVGIVTVITDHHLPPENLPDAAAVVDPHRNDDMSEFKEICGAQVAFKVICATENKEPEELLYEYADLLSVAIIGDYMPLVSENRSIVREGIKLIKQNHNIGLSAILSVAGINRNELDSLKLTYGIVPRINAAGRMSSALRALELINSNNMLSAISIANEIDELNSLRQKTEKDILSKVVKTIEDNNYNYDRVIVVSGDGYHQGVIGIVAARICEKYGKPAIVFSAGNGLAHGSGRSIKGFNLYDSLVASADTVEKFGGHELAAGVSLKSDNIDKFRIAVNNYAKTVTRPVPTINIDFKINPSALSLGMVDAVKALEPFGNGNPQPLFGIFGTKIQKITPIGQNKHLKILFSKNETSFQALMFNVSPDKFCFDLGDVVDLAISLDENNYKGDISLTVIVKAIRVSNTDESKLFADISAFDDFSSEKTVNRGLLAASREEIGQIYKYISSGKYSKERIIYKHINTIGFAKTSVSIQILEELNLISENDGFFSVTSNKKTELTNSDTYNIILNGGE